MCLKKAALILVMMCSAQFIEGIPASGGVIAGHHLNKRQASVSVVDDVSVNVDVNNAVAAPAVVAPAPAVSVGASVGSIIVPPRETLLALSDLDIIQLAIAVLPLFNLPTVLVQVYLPGVVANPLTLTVNEALAVAPTLPLDGPIYLIAAGLFVNQNSSAVYSALNYLISSTVIVVSVVEDNVENVAKALPQLALLLLPLIQLLPPALTTLIGIELGALLLSTVLLNPAASALKFLNVIAINPVLPLLATTALLGGLLTQNAIVISTVTGFFTIGSALVRSVIMPNTNMIYINPFDLNQYCTPSILGYFFCLLAYGVKIAIDILASAAIMVPVTALTSFDILVLPTVPIIGESVDIITLEILQQKVTPIYYYISSEAYSAKVVTGITLTSITSNIDTLLTTIQVLPILPALNFVIDQFVLTFYNIFAMGIVKLTFTVAGFALVIVVGAAQITITATTTLAQFTQLLLTALTQVLGNAAIDPSVLTNPIQFIYYNYVLNPLVNPLASGITTTAPIGLTSPSISVNLVQSPSSFTVSGTTGVQPTNGGVNGLVPSLVSGLSSTLGLDLSTALAPVEGLLTQVVGTVNDTLVEVVGSNPSFPGGPSSPSDGGLLGGLLGGSNGGFNGGLLGGSNGGSNGGLLGGSNGALLGGSNGGLLGGSNDGSNGGLLGK